MQRASEPLASPASNHSRSAWPNLSEGLYSREVLAKFDKCPSLLPDAPPGEAGVRRKGKSGKGSKSKHHRAKAKSTGKSAADKKGPGKPTADAADEEVITEDSEAASDLSHEYKVPRSRQALCPPLF